MIDDKIIDNLINPIVERQRAISLYTIKLIAQRVKKIGKLGKNNIDYLTLYNESREDAVKLRQLFNSYSKLQVKDIDKTIQTIIYYIYEDTLPIYEYRNIKQIDIRKRDRFWWMLLELDDELDEILASLDINKSVGFILDNTPMSVIDSYYNIVDKAVQAKTLDVLDYDTATKDMLSQLTKSELRYLDYRAEKNDYYSPRMDFWLEQYLQFIVNQINDKIQQDTIEQTNCDGIELSAHADSAPDHEPMQGHQFSLSEFQKLQSNQPSKDIHGNAFSAIVRRIGAWNCRHKIRAIIVGVTKPKYSQRQLDKMIERNAKGYTLPNGKHLSMYECKQRQNYYKRQIDIAKNEIDVASVANNQKLKNEYKAKLADYKAKYVAFSKACGLPVDKNYL